MVQKSDELKDRIDLSMEKPTVPARPIVHQENLQERVKEYLKNLTQTIVDKAVVYEEAQNIINGIEKMTKEDYVRNL